MTQRTKGIVLAVAAALCGLGALVGSLLDPPQGPIVAVVVFIGFMCGLMTGVGMLVAYIGDGR